MMRIVFLCTGNTCRSPMAAGIARRLAAERGLVDVEIESAGVDAMSGSGASDGALLVALEQGVDLSDHRSRLLTAAIVRDADLVLAMGERHLARAIELGGGSKSYLLTNYASRGNEPRSVSDPFGGDLATYRATYEELEHEIGRVIDRVVASRESGGR